jgi:Sugar-specific transcriptional regulator TrmB.
MPNDTRTDSGEFGEKYTDDDFISALQELDGGGTTEVSEALECPYTTAYDRLQSLQETGKVTSRDIGKVYFWEVPEPDE